MRRYVYRDKRTGKKVYSDIPVKHDRLVLVAAVKDGQMKQHEAQQT